MQNQKPAPTPAPTPTQTLRERMSSLVHGFEMSPYRVQVEAFVYDNAYGSVLDVAPGGVDRTWLHNIVSYETIGLDPPDAWYSHTHNANATDMRLTSCQYDTVICTEVIEHCDDPFALVRECIRVSKSLVLFTSPYVWPMHAKPDYWRISRDGWGLLIARAAELLGLDGRLDYVLKEAEWQSEKFSVDLTTANREQMAMTEMPIGYMTKVVRL